MPTLFKHALVTEVGTVATDIVTVDAGVRATVIGCNLANITDYDTVVADLYVFGADRYSCIKLFRLRACPRFSASDKVC